MSVLKTIKGALNNVQQVGSSLNKSLKKKNTKLPARTDGVNIDAGAELLNKFQEQWSEMHQRSSVNASAAERVASVLKVQYEKCEKQNEQMNQLLSMVSSLPQLMADISCLQDRICDMGEEFNRMEAGLVTLIDVKEQEDVIFNRNQHHQQLAVYKVRKNIELEQSKKRLADEHAQKMAGYEAKLQEHLQDKQQAFEEAFANEMQRYREYGNTQMRPLLANTPQVVELADIAIDEDTSALDAFLESDENGPETTSEIFKLNGEEDEEEDEDSYVNIGIVNTQLCDPEQDLDPLTPDLVNSGESDPSNSDPECDLTTLKQETHPELENKGKDYKISDENQNETPTDSAEGNITKNLTEKSVKKEENLESTTTPPVEPD